MTRRYRALVRAVRALVLPGLYLGCAVTGGAPSGMNPDGSGDAVSDGSSGGDASYLDATTDTSADHPSDLPLPETGPADATLDSPRDEGDGDDIGDASEAGEAAPAGDASDASEAADVAVDAMPFESGLPDGPMDAAHAGPLCAGPLVCPSGYGLCGLQCQPLDDPATGCNGGCTACPGYPNGAPTCVSHACALAECKPGFADLDNDAANGCETDITSPSSCVDGGACPDAAPYCGATGCRTTCPPPLTACGLRCVDLTSSTSNCGGCGSQCGGSCAGGTCSTPCGFGQVSCSGTDAGCADPFASPGNCSACGTTCTGDAGGTATNAVTTCSSTRGQCTISCPIGWSLCGNACAPLGTDPSNCGTCGHMCGAGDVCAQGSCATVQSLFIATALSNPQEIAVDDTRVYWTDRGSSSVKSVPKAGGSVTTIAQGQAGPQGIGLDDTFVYWSNNLGAAIMRAPKDGTGTPQVVVNIASPTDFVVLGGNVYFLEGAAIDSAPVTGGSATQLSPPDGGVTCCGSYSYLATDGTSLYTFVPPGGIGVSLLSVSPATGAATPLGEYHSPDTMVGGSGTMCAPGLPDYNFVSCTNGLEFSTYPYEAELLAPTSCGVAWSSDKTSIMFAPSGLSQSITPPALISGLASGGVSYLAADQDSVYWLDKADSAIGRVPLP